MLKEFKQFMEKLRQEHEQEKKLKRLNYGKS